MQTTYASRTRKKQHTNKQQPHGFMISRSAQPKAKEYSFACRFVCMSVCLSVYSYACLTVRVSIFAVCQFLVACMLYANLWRVCSVCLYLVCSLFASSEYCPSEVGNSLTDAHFRGPFSFLVQCSRNCRHLNSKVRPRPV